MVIPACGSTENEKNLGAAATWNRAISLATAPYVKVLCSDDALRPTCLARQVGVLDADRSETIQLVIARRDIVDASDRVLIAGRGLGRLRGRVGGREAVRQLVVAGSNIFGEPSTTLFRRDTLERVGGFDSRWRYAIDVAAYAAVLHHGDVFAVDDTLSTFRVGPHSWSSRLAASQGREYRQFVRAVSADPYFGISPTQRMMGEIRATGVAIARTAFFRWASRRGRARAPQRRQSPQVA